MNRSLGILALGLLLSAARPAPGKEPELVDVRLHPAAIHLIHQDDRQAYVVQATYSDGTTKDVTARARSVLANPRIAALDKQLFLRPLADGQTELQLSFAGKTMVLAITVTEATTPTPIRFVNDVMPVFMKAGCNTGSCHGAARGKDGFRLSLFGYDPDGDYFRLTREALGRRINLALPEDSLVLEKGANRVPHTGGQRFKPEDEPYQTLLKWLQAGAPRDPTNTARVTDIEMFPTQAVLEGAGTTQRLNVRAKFSDGTERDVTRRAVFLTSNEDAVKVSTEGLVTAGKRGEAFVMARFDNFTVGAQVVSIPRDTSFAWPRVPENNYIDTLVHAKLRKIRVLPSDLCDDATFLRRVSLDAIGLLPTAEETRQFIADADPGKRAKKIDALIGRKEFVALWVMKWAELLQIRTDANQFQYKSALQYYTWLQDEFARGEPIDRVLRQLIAAKGGTFHDPEANFYKVETDTLKLTENVAQVFMGMRIQCAQCHNHPFDRWRMDDYYGFAAFFAQIGRKPGEDPRETVIFNSGSGGAKHPVTGRDLPPKFLGGAQPDLKPGEDRREVLARWLTSPQNPQFARNVANLIWAHFLGRGIVEPVDDVRISNPPANPELLSALSEKLTAAHYDFRELVRDICNSRTYQLSSRTNASNADDTRNFARATIRRLRAEVLLDVINQVTESRDKFRGLPPGARAVEIVDGKTTSYFLTTFGRATRDTVCACEVKMEPSLSQALHLLNGDTVNSKVVNGGVLQRWLKEGKRPQDIVTELYWRCFSRPPTAEESNRLEPLLQGGASPTETLGDLFWSILNSKEFIFNH